MEFGGFKLCEQDGVRYYAVSFLEQTGLVRAAFTTRVGGVSTGETASMNFSTKRRDTVENVRENYRRICRAAGFSVDGLAVSIQTHETTVHEVLEGEVGRGVFDDTPSVEADGLMTNRPGVALIKHSADCVPVYLLDTANKAVALVHAGWRGTVERIAQEALRRMAEVYGTRPQDCLAAVGPSIGPCCFVVGEDVAERFETEFPGWGLVDRASGQAAGDLWRCNAKQLIEAGVPEGQIAVAGMCTACATETFYSHRKEQGRCGAMAAMMELVM
jgi:YfiH family protein